MTQANALPEEAKPRKRRRWVVVTLVVVSILLFTKVDCFICGLLGKPVWTFAMCLSVGMWVAPVAAAYLLSALIVKLVKWRTWRFWTRPTTAAFLIVIYFAPIVIPNTPHRLGFWIWARRNIDADAVAKWADTAVLPATVKPDSHGWQDVPYDMLPPSLLPVVQSAYWKGEWVRGPNLGPSVKFNKTTRTVQLCWSSGILGWWGVTIGRGVADKDDAWLRLSPDAYAYEHEPSHAAGAIVVVAAQARWG